MHRTPLHHSHQLAFHSVTLTPLLPTFTLLHPRHTTAMRPVLRTACRTARASGGATRRPSTFIFPPASTASLSTLHSFRHDTCTSHPLRTTLFSIHASHFSSSSHPLPLSELTAISPIDGRYASMSSPLRSVFSEYGLIEKRVVVEIRWLQTLARNPNISEVSHSSAHTTSMCGV